MELAIVALGAVLIGMFAFSNLWLDRAWFPTLSKTKAAKRSALPSVSRIREVRGIVEATLLFAGTALIAAAFTKIAVNSGYGGF